MVIEKELIQQAFFQDESFEQTWSDILNQYRNLGFHDEISDDEMISEFKYIKQQLRKYKFSKQDQVLSCDTVEDMFNVVENLIGNAAEYGDSRKEIVYNFLRDHWLLGVYNTLGQVLMNNVEEDEDE